MPYNENPNGTKSSYVKANTPSSSDKHQEDLSAIANSLKEIQQQMKQNEAAFENNFLKNPASKHHSFEKAPTEPSPTEQNQQFQHLQAPEFQKDPDLETNFFYRTNQSQKKEAKLNTSPQNNHEALRKLFAQTKKEEKFTPIENENQSHKPTLQMLYEEIARAEDQQRFQSELDHQSTNTQNFSQDILEPNPFFSSNFDHKLNSKQDFKNSNKPDPLFLEALKDQQQEQISKLEQKFDDLDNMLMAEYRDRQTKHKHLINFLEKHSQLIQLIGEQLNHIAQQKGEQKELDFETLFIAKLQQVIARSEQNILQQTHSLVEDTRSQIAKIAEPLATSEQLVQLYDILQQDYDNRFTVLEEKINFLATQQILQQKMHAQLIKMQIHEQQQKNATPNVVKTPKSTQNQTFDQNPNEAYQKQTQEKGFYQQASASPTKTANAPNATRSFQDLVAEKNIAQPNIPKSWQDALTQLFQQPPLENDFENSQKEPLNIEASARLIERNRAPYGLN